MFTPAAVPESDPDPGAEPSPSPQPGVPPASGSTADKCLVDATLTAKNPLWYLLLPLVMAPLFASGVITVPQVNLSVFNTAFAQLNPGNGQRWPGRNGEPQPDPFADVRGELNRLGAFFASPDGRGLSTALTALLAGTVVAGALGLYYGLTCE